MSRPIGVVDPQKWRDLSSIVLSGIVLLKIGMWWTCCWFQGGWLVIFVADGIRLGGERWGPVNAALNPIPASQCAGQPGYAGWDPSVLVMCHVWMGTEFTDLIKNARQMEKRKNAIVGSKLGKREYSTMAKWHQRLLLINSRADDGIIG